MEPKVIDHLKSISSLYKDLGNEIQIFCPYCNDAVRKPNPTHGHLYISKTQPVFICFRCGTSGSLYKLLIDTGFDDDLILDKLRKSARIAIDKVEQTTSTDRIKEMILDRNYEFMKQDPEGYNQFMQYVGSRVIGGWIDYNLYPKRYRNNIMIVFVNAFGKDVFGRFINPVNNFRYLSIAKTDYYFFQDPNLTLNGDNDIVITEGGFDLLTVYELGVFTNNPFYIAIGGKRYYAVINYLMKWLTFGKYRLRIVLDADNLGMKRRIRALIKRRLQHLNPLIEYQFYKPIYGNDINSSWTIESC